MINFYQYFSLLRPFASFLLMNTTDKRSQRDNSCPGRPVEVSRSVLVVILAFLISGDDFCDMWINAIKGNNALNDGGEKERKKYAARNTWKNIDDREHSGRLNVLHLTKKYIYLFTLRQWLYCSQFAVFPVAFFLLPSRQFLGRSNERERDASLWSFSSTQGWKY
jgi:hypothetical protein